MAMDQKDYELVRKIYEDHSKVLDSNVKILKFHLIDKSQQIAERLGLPFLGEKVFLLLERSFSTSKEDLPAVRQAIELMLDTWPEGDDILDLAKLDSSRMVTAFQSLTRIEAFTGGPIPKTRSKRSIHKPSR